MMSIVQVCIYDRSVQIKTQQSKRTLQCNEPIHKQMQTHAWHPEYHFSSWIQLVTAPCLDSHVTFDSLLQMLCKTNCRWQKQTKQWSNSWQNKLLPHTKKELRALKYLDISSALTVAQIPFCERIQEAYSNQIHHLQATTTKSQKQLCSKKETVRTKSCQVDDIPHTNQHRKPHKQKRLK